MILTDNVMVLKNLFPGALSYLKKREEVLENNNLVKIVKARNGLDTVATTRNDCIHYLHSQYDPVNEANRLIDSLGDISRYKHVFFYGVGLGYHLQVFFEKYGKINFTIYEPEAAVFYRFVEKNSLNAFPIRYLQNIYLDAQHVNDYIHDFISKIKDQVLLIVPPSYEKVYNEETKDFYAKFQKAIEKSRDGLQVSVGYEKLWVTNSIKNFPQVLDTVSVMRDKKHVFANKPVLIVAAGPSLQEEFDNLKYIKANKLAYIIAIGSANKALLSNGIIPDALTTYDPNTWNHTVYEEIINDKIDSIPLIFGSSVGYHTVELYPGPMLHMITSQDPIAAYFLNETELQTNQEIISDAPSIAVLTMEMLAKFGAGPVVLVGQNFAFKAEQYYAAGVNYNYRSIELTGAEKAELVEVESVDGGFVNTIPAHSSSRYNMEAIIGRFVGKMQVINTTKGGAKIAGTVFYTLEEVIKGFSEPVVEDDWYKGAPTPYNTEFFSRQINKMNRSKKKYEQIMNLCIKHLMKIERLLDKKDSKLLDGMYPKLDGATTDLLKNEFFTVFIRPMVRVHCDVVSRATKNISIEPSPVKKARMIIDSMGPFFLACRNIEDHCDELYKEMLDKTAYYIEKKVELA